MNRQRENGKAKKLSRKQRDLVEKDQIPISKEPKQTTTTTLKDDDKRDKWNSDESVEVKYLGTWYPGFILEKDDVGPWKVKYVFPVVETSRPNFIGIQVGVFYSQNIRKRETLEVRDEVAVFDYYMKENDTFRMAEYQGHDMYQGFKFQYHGSQDPKCMNMAWILSEHELTMFQDIKRNWKEISQIEWKGNESIEFYSQDSWSWCPGHIKEGVAAGHIMVNISYTAKEEEVVTKLIDKRYIRRRPSTPPVQECRKPEEEAHPEPEAPSEVELEVPEMENEAPPGEWKVGTQVYIYTTTEGAWRTGTIVTVKGEELQINYRGGDGQSWGKPLSAKSNRIQKVQDGKDAPTAPPRLSHDFEIGRHRLMDSTTAVGVGAVATCGMAILGYFAYRLHRFWTAKRRPQETDAMV